METIPELQPIVEEGTPVLSDRATELVQQIEQAALQPVSSAEKLELVDQLTDYVSDALAEGLMADDELQYIFQLTTQLGETSPQHIAETAAVACLNSTAAVNTSAVKQQRTTSDLLSWADDIAAIEGSLTGNASLSGDDLADPELVDVLAQDQQMTSNEAAAKALLKAARHNQKRARGKATASRYMDSSSSRLVIPVHATASGNLEAEGFLGAVVKPGRRHATPAYLQGLQANVSSNTPAHLRLYQLSETWRAHKEQLRTEQEEKQAQAASPTPPARLSSQARQRAADRLYAHAVQRQMRQHAAREEQAREDSPPRSLRPCRNAPDFFQRQQDLLARRQYLAEQRRPRDEESLQHCTGKPVISAFAHSMHRSRDDLLAWHARKEERVRRLRMQQSLQDEQEVTLSPRINPASRHMALSLARRAAQQDPHLLTVIQSQPEGWVLGNRPATARRPVTAPGTTTAEAAQKVQFPCWVQAGGTSSMRLLQKAAEKATPGGHSSSSWAESQSEHRGGSAGFEGAPWMGHGGVHHPDAGHIEASLKGSQTVSHSGVVSPPSGRSGAALHPSGHSGAALEKPSGPLPHKAGSVSSHHAVDPIEAPAPAWALDPTLHTPHAPPLAAQAASINSHESSSDTLVQSSEAGRAGRATVLPWVGQADTSLSSYSDQRHAGAAVHSHSLDTDTSALHGRALNRPAPQAGSAVDSWTKADVTNPSVRPASRDSRPAAAGAADEWHGFADADITENADIDADFGSSESFAATASAPVHSSSNGDRTEARQKPSLLAREQQGSTGFSGFDVADGKQTPDLSRLSSDKGMKVNQPGAPVERTRSAIFSRGSEDIPSGNGYAVGGDAALSFERQTSKQQQRPGPDESKAVQPAVASPKVSGKALRALALKAAAEAAAAATAKPASATALSRAGQTKAGQARTSPYKQGMGGEVNRQQEMVAQQTSTGRQAGAGEVVSMHSVMKQKPAPLNHRKPRASLDMRAYSAAIEHMLAVKDSVSGQNAMGTYSRQASARPSTSTEKKGNGMIAASPAAVSHRLFSPVNTESSGYRKKHGKVVGANKVY